MPPEEPPEVRDVAGRPGQVSAQVKEATDLADVARLDASFKGLLRPALALSQGGGAA